MTLGPQDLWPALAIDRVTTSTSYSTEVVKKRSRGPRSLLPTSREQGAFLSINKDLFTEDAWRGMLRLQDYATYVETVAAEAEKRPGCEECLDNRLFLERAWQVVANEYYDPHLHFSQADWAGQLLQTLQASEGHLQTRKEAYAAVDQMIRHLGDHYTSFLMPTAFRREIRQPHPAERKYLAAQSVGVGMSLGPQAPGGGRVVESPMAASPAEAAGIVRGDRLLEVDDVPLNNLTLEQSMSLLRGPVGSSVKVVLAPRSPQDTPRVFSLERRLLPQPPVRDTRLTLKDGQEVCYIRVLYFSKDTTKRLIRILKEAEQEGVAGYIMDVRNDPGGVFEEAIAISSLFLAPGQKIADTVRGGAVVDTSYHAGSLSAEVFGQLPGQLTRQPVMILTNSSSASASEVFAGALQGNGRSKLIGEKTFGKGVVQYYFPLGDGSGVKVTVEKYLTPHHHDISLQGGLLPNVYCHDFPHGVFTSGTADRCVLSAMERIMEEKTA